MQNRAIMTVRRLIIAMLMMLLAQAPHAWTQDSEQSSEYLIKAGYIYNFAKLVEWPASAFAQPDSPIVIGIVGTDPFGPIIDKVLEGKKVNGHAFVIKRLKPTADVKECHILFIVRRSVPTSPIPFVLREALLFSPSVRFLDLPIAVESST